MENRRLRVTSKGGNVEWVYFQSGAARALPRLLRGRSSGPLFVTDLRPGPARAPAAADVCPTTGRVRISYRRMAELVVEHSGWPTHAYRKAQLSYLGAKGYGDAAGDGDGVGQPWAGGTGSAAVNPRFTAAAPRSASDHFLPGGRARPGET